MHAKLASVIFALVAFVPSTASCFELIDIGLFNGNWAPITAPDRLQQRPPH